MSRKLQGTIISIILIALVSVALDYHYCSSKFTMAGQLIILALTLVVLIIYAWDTRRIADATEQKWEEELRPKLFYDIKLDPDREGRVILTLMNTTDYIVRAKINCNFKVYGESVSLSDAYNGVEDWVVFPQQASSGHFNINSILNRKGSEYSQMSLESTNENESEQLTMDFEMSFENEIGRRRSYPPRKHYFNFKRGLWIPSLTA